MASLHVRNVDDALVQHLKLRAARRGRSAEAEHREILKEALAEDAVTSFDELAALSRSLTRDKTQPSSEALIREDRDR